MTPLRAAGVAGLALLLQACATRLAVERLAQKVGQAPIHLVGYSTGAPLALGFTLEAIEGGARSAAVSRTEGLGLSWPVGVISLSHVALPIPPDDPLYGQRPPDNADVLFLGQMAFQGERGMLRLSSDWLLRLRHNPFYAYLEERTLGWIEGAGPPH